MTGRRPIDHGYRYTSAERLQHQATFLVPRIKYADLGVKIRAAFLLHELRAVGCDRLDVQ